MFPAGHRVAAQRDNEQCANGPIALAIYVQSSCFFKTMNHILASRQVGDLVNYLKSLVP
jgi:hypothetical protein